MLMRMVQSDSLQLCEDTAHRTVWRVHNSAMIFTLPYNNTL
jgi:hypothetical protein